MKASVKKSLNILQKLYMGGLIMYPRVSNDFERNPTFEIFPHPPLPIISGVNEPLKKQEIKIKKKSSLLMLGLLKLVKPSTLERTAERIDEYYDEDLEFLDEKKREMFTSISATFDEFLEEEQITEKELLSMANSFYSPSNKESVSNSLQIFHINGLSFIQSENKKNEKNKFLFTKKKKEDLEFSEEAIFDNLDERYSNIEMFMASLKNSNKLNQNVKIINNNEEQDNARQHNN